MKLDEFKETLNDIYSKETCYPDCRNNWNEKI